MKRDMDLIRLILLKIEAEYQSTGLCNLQIEGYEPEVVAFHCKILNERGLISSYKARYADDKIYFFSVGGLTWDGCDYLERIRDNSQWTKIKRIDDISENQNLRIFCYYEIMHYLDAACDKTLSVLENKNECVRTSDKATGV